MRRTRRAASSCLSTWCETWDCHTRRRQLLHKAQVRDEERKKELTMGRWIVAHMHKKERLERCAHAVATMQRRRLRVAFHLYARAVQVRERETRGRILVGLVTLFSSGVTGFAAS